MRSGRIARIVLVVALTVACGSSSSPVASPTPTPTTTPTVSPTASPTVRPASAADSLRAYFAAAEQADRRLREVAVLVNGSLGRTVARFTSSTRTAVATALPDSVGRAIPAGLPADLQQAVLVVQSDLVGREAAFKRVRWASSPLLLSSEEGKDLLRCLGNGSPLARHFAADLRTAKELAGSLPAVPPVGRGSTAGLELAVRLQLIDVGHNGCDSCGGTVQRQLAKVVHDPRSTQLWGTSNAGWTHFGTVDGVPFRARYASATWRVQLLAC